MRVDEAIEADLAAFEREKGALGTRIVQQKQGRAYTAWIQNLEAKADIKDYRENY